MLQESDLPPKLACRLIFLSLLIMSLLLYNYYTSIMVALLLNPEPKIYETVSELAHSNFEIGLDLRPYVIDWFNTVTRTDVQYLYKNKLSRTNNINSYPPEKGISKVREGMFAYHVDTGFGYEAIAKNFNQSEVCDLAEIQMMPTAQSGFLVRKDYKFAEWFQIRYRKQYFLCNL